MAKPMQVSVDCTDPRKLAAFWSEVLDYTVTELSDPREKCLAVDPHGVGPRLLFHRVPEEKLVKNRLHLDVIASGWGTPKDAQRPIVDAEVERLVALGASLVRIMDKPADYFAVMTDPEGNEFCIA